MAKKDVIEAEVLPPEEANTLPVLAKSMMPANGLVVDNQAAVSYVAAARRRVLKDAREQCTATRKQFATRAEAIQKEIKGLCEEQVKDEAADFIKTLTTAFKATGLKFTVEAEIESVPKEDSDSSLIVYSRTIKNPDRSYSNEIWSDTVKAKPSAEVKKLQTKLDKVMKGLAEINEADVKIQREIHELQFSTLETQAIIFKMSMEADESGKGKTFMQALDSKLDSMPKMPKLPTLEA